MLAPALARNIAEVEGKRGLANTTQLGTANADGTHANVDAEGDPQRHPPTSELAPAGATSGYDRRDRTRHGGCGPNPVVAQQN